MDFLGKPCPVCSRTFREDDDIVVCPKCGAPYHRECYHEKGRCIFSDLHKKHQSWQEIQEDNAKQNDTESNTIVCPRCSTVNPDNAIVCKKCGSFLAKNIDMNSEIPFENESDTTKGGIPPFGNDSPFSFFLDPMGGVSPDEDFDGVTGAELSKYVTNNTTYYLPVFEQYKKQKRNRFNFCAFLFVGAWYLYRKQYVKGALLSVLYLINELAALMCSAYFTNPLIKEANTFYSGRNYVTITDYFSWAINNKSFGEVLLMFLPQILYVMFLIVRVICGIRGNKSYYKSAVAKIKKIKGSSADEVSDKQKEIAAAGGVNAPIAWVCLMCYIILSFASLFL